MNSPRDLPFTALVSVTQQSQEGLITSPQLALYKRLGMVDPSTIGAAVAEIFHVTLRPLTDPESLPHIATITSVFNDATTLAVEGLGEKSVCTLHQLKQRMNETAAAVPHMLQQRIPQLSGQEILKISALYNTRSARLAGSMERSVARYSGHQC